MVVQNESVVHPKHEEFLDTLANLITPATDSQEQIKKSDYNVILSKNKSVEYKLEQEKLEHRAKMLMAKERKELRDRHHIRPNITKIDFQDTSIQTENPKSLLAKDRNLGWDLDHEKTLKKAATRGVVKLFNALKAQKDAAAKKLSKVPTVRKNPVMASNEMKAELASTSKAAFLDFLTRPSPAAAGIKRPFSLLEKEETEAKLEDWDDI